MNTVQKLATASWAVPLVYAFSARLVGFVIGQVLADRLVFAVAVAGVLVALFCLIAMTRHGRKGILGPAIAGLLVSGMLLAIWIPNYLAARERARSKSVTLAAPIMSR